MRFPVSADFFTCAALPEEEKRYLVHIARTSCKELIKHAQMNDDNVQWTPIGRNEPTPTTRKFRSPSLSSQRGDLEMHSIMYEGRLKREWAKKFHGNMMMGACVTQVAGSLEEVAMFYQRPTTREAREFAQMYNEDCLDTSVLYTLVAPTNQNPWHNVTVRWHVVKSPVALGKHRDFCFVETHDEFVDANGRRGWVLARESVSISACPALSGMNLVRATIQRSGFVFIESELPGFLNVIQMTLIDFKGNLPRVISRLATRRNLSEVLSLNRYLHERRLSQEHILGDVDLVPKRDRSACHICHKKFGMFVRHKVRCRKCGEVVCMSCQGLWTVDTAVNPSLPRVDRKAKKNVRVCVSCSQDTRERSLNMNSTFLTTQLLRTVDDDNVMELAQRESDISPINVLQSARSRALHEYVRRTSTSVLLLNTEQDMPELPSPVTPSSVVEQIRKSKSYPLTHDDDDSSWEALLPTLPKENRVISHSFVNEASRTSFGLKKQAYRRGSMPHYTDVASHVEAALKYVPPSPAKTRKPVTPRKAYTPRKSGQTFQFQDNKLVGIRSSAGNYNADELKSIERSLLAESKKRDYNFPTFGIEDSRRATTSKVDLSALSRSGRGNKENSSFLSNATATPAHTSTSSSSMSFSDDLDMNDSGTSIDGLREKVQQTLSNNTTQDGDYVALYKRMKAVRVDM